MNEKAESTKSRIYEATKVNVDPIYYAAGYKDGNEQQYPWNLSKLLAYILKHTKKEKRIVFAKEINQNQKVWESDDRLEKYQEQVKQSFIESFIVNVSSGVGKAAEIVGNVASTVISGLASAGKALGGAVSTAMSWVRSWW